MGPHYHVTRLPAYNGTMGRRSVLWRGWFCLDRRREEGRAIFSGSFNMAAACVRAVPACVSRPAASWPVCQFEIVPSKWAMLQRTHLQDASALRTSIEKLSVKNCNACSIHTLILIYPRNTFGKLIDFCPPFSLWKSMRKLLFLQWFHMQLDLHSWFFSHNLCPRQYSKLAHNSLQSRLLELS